PLKRVDEALGGALSRVSQEEKFNVEIGKGVMINTLGKIRAERVLLIDLGKKQKFSSDVLRKAGIFTAKRAKPFSESIAFGFAVDGKKENASALIEGIMLGGYEFNHKKTKDKQGEAIK